MSKHLGDQHDPPIRKSITLPASLWREISDHRFSQRIASEAETVRRLLSSSLRASGDGRKLAGKGAKS